mmetsp:Transcript_40290/g.86499  ORF Transcript_40290/g.86499 Transcript_40290/m.86499 type:complete len:289 (+) Transcript_40290:1068-1934(+)
MRRKRNRTRTSRPILGKRALKEMRTVSPNEGRRAKTKMRTTNPRPSFRKGVKAKTKTVTKRRGMMTSLRLGSRSKRTTKSRTNRRAVLTNPARQQDQKEKEKQKQKQKELRTTTATGRVPLRKAIRNMRRRRTSMQSLKRTVSSRRLRTKKKPTQRPPQPPSPTERRKRQIGKTRKNLPSPTPRARANKSRRGNLQQMERKARKQKKKKKQKEEAEEETIGHRTRSRWMGSLWSYCFDSSLCCLGDHAEPMDSGQQFESKTTAQGTRTHFWLDLSANSTNTRRERPRQ